VLLFALFCLFLLEFRIQVRWNCDGFELLKIIFYKFNLLSFALFDFLSVWRSDENEMI